MTADLAKLQSVFHDALEFESRRERSAFLDEVCGEDDAFRRQVEALLEAHDAPDSRLDAGPHGANDTNLYPSALPLGTQIGPYKLLEQIGEGGLGIVYLAKQEQPVRRRVALKLIKPGMDSREIIRRFQAERQALALMDHPNIAKVLDAGTTESGHPYFVMELIKGVAITTYCQQCQFTTRQRLELFVAVCHAVQHAHQKGIIHRDIKPTNVLVAMQDRHPVPKVIDFGVAKALNQRLTDETLHTRFAHMVGTPLYMSPEQAEMSQLDVDTRSDVYSLGVLLYELLTGTTPFTSERLQKASYDELRRIIREEEPPKPSSRITTQGHLATTAARQQRTDSRSLTRTIRGDLDWIVMKAMEKDRGRRYDTAAALAADVDRFLNDQTIEARPPSAAYQFSKFYRRNRLAITTGTIVMLTAMLGVGISTALVASQRNAARAAADEADRQRDEARRQEANAQVKAEEAERERARANENLRQAKALVDTMLTRTAEELRDVPHATRIREALLDDALSFYQGFLDQSSQDPEIRRETGFAYLRLGEILESLGRSEERIEPTREAVAIFDDLAEEFEDALEYQDLRANAYRNLADAYFFSYRVKESVEAGRHALDLHEQLVNDHPDNPHLRRNLLDHYTNFGNQLHREDLRSEAVACHRKAVDGWDRYRKDFPEEPLDDEWIAHANHWLGSQLTSQCRFDEGDRHLRTALELREETVANDENNLPFPRHQLGHVQQYVVTLRINDGRLEEAESLARASVKIFERLDEQFPNRLLYRQRHFSGLEQLGRILYGMARYEEAEDALRRAHELRKALAPAKGTQELLQYSLAWSKYNLGMIDHHYGREDRAAQRFGEALERFEAELTRQPQTIEIQNAVRWILLTCPLPQFRDHERGLELSRQLVKRQPESADQWGHLALAHLRMSDWQQAINALNMAIERADADSFDFYVLAIADWHLGNKDKAREWYRRGVEYRYSFKLSNYPDLLQIRSEDHKFRFEGTSYPDLLNLRAEAEEVLAIASPDTEPPPDESPRRDIP